MGSSLGGGFSGAVIGSLGMLRVRINNSSGEYSTPIAQKFIFDSWPGIEDATLVEFRLTYQGRLPAASGSEKRNKDKHRIRQSLHPQLKELWRTDPNRSPATSIPYDHVSDECGAELFVDRFANNYARCGYRFLPLIGGPAGDESCAIDILFLRRDQPGNLVTSGGDIDNRMKVLLDALRMQQECQEIPGQVPLQSDEDPFFCLLRDDSLITQLTIVTDHLLTPVTTGENIHDVHLIIGERTITYASYMEWVR